MSSITTQLLLTIVCSNKELCSRTTELVICKKYTWSRCQCHYLQHSRDSPFEWIKTISLLNICIRETPPAWTIFKARGTG